MSILSPIYFQYIPNHRYPFPTVWLINRGVPFKQPKSENKWYAKANPLFSLEAPCFSQYLLCLLRQSATSCANDRQRRRHRCPRRPTKTPRRWSTPWSERGIHMVSPWKVEHQWTYVYIYIENMCIYIYICNIYIYMYIYICIYI